MTPSIRDYNQALSQAHAQVCTLLATEIDAALPDAESKIWHAHPVWFLSSNPIVGYSKQKAGIRLMFWSGADFEEAGLDVVGKKFKDASVFYDAIDDVEVAHLRRWLTKSREIQWDYARLRKHGGLRRLT